MPALPDEELLALPAHEERLLALPAHEELLALPGVEALPSLPGAPPASSDETQWHSEATESPDGHGPWIAAFGAALTRVALGW